MLITTVESPEVAAQWNNNVQALCEGTALGIPANNSSDPRHQTEANAEFNAGSGGKISMWPGSLGMAASFDPELVKQFGQIASAGIPRTGYCHCIITTDRHCHRAPLESFQRNFRRKPPAYFRYGKGLCGRIPDFNWRQGNR